VILVAGGTGRLGRQVVRRLCASGRPVRVLTRDPARALPLDGTGAEIVLGDVRNPADLVPAMQEIDLVVSAVQGFAGPGRVSPESVDRQGNANLVDAAVAVGADVVLMSGVDASPSSRMELFRAKYAAEQHLQESGAAWTIIRASAFVELWADIMAKPIVLGRGENPINFVSVGDVAAIVERAVLDPSMRGHILEVGGPQDLTFHQLAAILQDVRGTTDKVRHVPRPVLRGLAPISRKVRAALAMDTMDMTFDAASARSGFADMPFTEVGVALAAAEPVGSPATRGRRG
jgi:uncharacterized protein YbjT (DUF2867 family)